MNTGVLLRAQMLVKDTQKVVEKVRFNTRFPRLILIVALLVNMVGGLASKAVHAAAESPPPLPITTQSVGQYFDTEVARQMADRNVSRTVRQK